MNLAEQKILTDRAVEAAIEYGYQPEEIEVSMQIDIQDKDSVCSTDVEMIYDNDGQASGCVWVGVIMASQQKHKERPAISCGFCHSRDIGEDKCNQCGREL